MRYRELMRRKLMEEIYNGLSPEDKRTFIQLAAQQKNHEEIAEALRKQQDRLDIIERKQNWKVDFLSDVGANFLTDGLIWLGSRLFKK